MNLYKIVYCYLNPDGSVECDESGEEKFYVKNILARDMYLAVKKLETLEEFKNKPEIFEIRKI